MPKVGKPYHFEGIDVYYPELSFSERLCPKCCVLLGIFIVSCRVCVGFLLVLMLNL